MSSHNRRHFNQLRTKEQVQRDYSLTCLNIGKLTTMIEEEEESVKRAKSELNDYKFEASSEAKETPEYHQQVAILEMKLGDHLAKIKIYPKDLERYYQKLEVLAREQTKESPKEKTDDSTPQLHAVATDETTEPTTATDVLPLSTETSTASNEVQNAH